MSEIFDDLDFLDQVAIEDGEESEVIQVTTNEEISSKLKEVPKQVTSKRLSRDVSYPYFEILLTADSQVNPITVDAINRLLSSASEHAKSSEDLEKATASDFLCVGVSADESLGGVAKQRVMGVMHISKLRHFYTLVRNLESNFYLSEDRVLAGSSVLALL